MELGLDQAIIDSPAAQEIQHQLQEWLRSRCPDHLGAILEDEERTRWLLPEHKRTITRR